MSSEAYLRNAAEVRFLGMTCPRGRNNIPEGASHGRGKATFSFSVTANNYRSLVSANTPRGGDITGVSFLWILLLLCVSPQQTSQKGSQSMLPALSVLDDSASSWTKLSRSLHRDKTHKVHPTNKHASLKLRHLGGDQEWIVVARVSAPVTSTHSPKVDSWQLLRG